MQKVPAERAYWAEPGRVLAGAFPGHPNEPESARRIRAFLDVGIRTSVNLMFDDEVDHDGNLFKPYEPIVEREAITLGIEARCLRFPIRDVSIPSLETMDEIRKALRESRARNEAAFVHCWGGRGRTGQVIGVHLIEHGQANSSDFVNRIATLRIDDRGGGLSPETDEQIGFVREYVRERGLEVRG